MLRQNILSLPYSVERIEDYGNNNDAILKMWEEVKSDPLPNWGLILLLSEVAIGAGALLIFIINKKVSYSNRKKYRKEYKRRLIWNEKI